MPPADPSSDVRPAARTPRGFGDRRGGELRRQRAILEAVSKVYEAHGFEPLETSAFEYADALGKFLPDADRPNEGVFALRDDDGDETGEWMALRYDLTAPLARFAAQNWETLPKPFRRYAFGTVWRNEKPGPGRFREFVQCDADTVGSARPEADAEIIAMAVAGLEAAGLPRGAAVIKINNRKLLNGLLATVGVTSESVLLSALRAIDKLDRLGTEEVHKLLTVGRMDDSGDFTKGVGLTDVQASTIAAFMRAAKDLPFPETATRSAQLDAIAEVISGSAEGDAGLAELAGIDAALTAMGVGTDRAVFDTTVVRGLEYYTGAVFEADAGEVVDGLGKRINFGSVGGGGRYDDLVARFTGQAVPATGFSFGVSRLSAVLAARAWLGTGAQEQARGPVVVIAFNRENMSLYFELAAQLRQDLQATGVGVEVYLGESGMKAQMKYADRRNSPAVVILGDDEIAAGKVTVKDLDLGRELAGGLADSAAWRAERPGQETVPRAELAAFVRRIVSPPAA